MRGLKSQKANFSPAGTDPSFIPTGYRPQFLTEEDVRERERLVAVERRIDTIIRDIETASVAIPDCGKAAPLPNVDTRAAFDTFDRRHKEIRACLDAAAEKIDAERAKLSQLLAELKGILDELWDQWPEDTKGDAIKRIEELAQTISSKVAAARAAHAKQVATWKRVLNSRNVLLGDMKIEREQRRAMERRERLRAENLRREAILDEQQRQAWIDELNTIPRDLPGYDPMADPTSDVYQQFMLRSEQAYYGTRSSGSGISMRAVCSYGGNSDPSSEDCARRREAAEAWRNMDSEPLRPGASPLPERQNGRSSSDYCPDRNCVTAR